MRTLELGVFMPVGTNGFLMSTTAPRYQPTFALERTIATLAEEAGFDFLFSMGKWMGFGGRSGFWEQTIEPVVMSAALASVTNRIKLFATINPLLFHPVVAAKMIATIDEISGGRFGVNIVTGNTLEELEQMGVVPEGYETFRYEYADEWLTVVKQLWTQQRLTHDGRFFQLTNCVCDPKPIQKPYPPIISAGLSDEGLRFGAKHSNYQFVGARPEKVDHVKAFAAEEGRDLKVSANMLIVAGSSDQAAHDRFERLLDGRDNEAFDNLIASFERDNRGSSEGRTSFLRNPRMIGFGTGAPIIGSYDTIAEQLAHVATDAKFDAIQLTFIDFIDDLKDFGRQIYPGLKARLARHDIRLGQDVAASARAAEHA
ncbi:LLM class flavin-dependent oxidoreductase [Neorhizobium sp. IRAMC:178]|uniref:LLM class flavin-dependent oxidoreductase n=1 Tax=Neorhizobium tunisiense TaxID=3144793 RepID=UPI0031F6A902